MLRETTLTYQLALTNLKTNKQIADILHSLKLQIPFFLDAIQLSLYKSSKDDYS